MTENDSLFYPLYANKWKILGLALYLKILYQMLFIEVTQFFPFEVTTLIYQSCILGVLGYAVSVTSRKTGAPALVVPMIFNTFWLISYSMAYIWDLSPYIGLPVGFILGGALNSLQLMPSRRIKESQVKPVGLLFSLVVSVVLLILSRLYFEWLHENHWQYIMSPYPMQFWDFDRIRIISGDDYGLTIHPVFLVVLGVTVLVYLYEKYRSNNPRFSVFMVGGLAGIVSMLNPMAKNLVGGSVNLHPGLLTPVSIILVGGYLAGRKHWSGFRRTFLVYWLGFMFLLLSLEMALPSLDIVNDYVIPIMAITAAFGKWVQGRTSNKYVTIAGSVLLFVIVFTGTLYASDIDFYNQRNNLRDDTQCIEVIREAYPSYPFIELWELKYDSYGDIPARVRNQLDKTPRMCRSFFAYQQDPLTNWEVDMITGVLGENMELIIIHEGKTAIANVGDESELIWEALLICILIAVGLPLLVLYGHRMYRRRLLIDGNKS